MTLDSSERRTTAPTRPGTDAVTATAAPHMKRVLGLPALVFFVPCAILLMIFFSALQGVYRA